MLGDRPVESMYVAFFAFQRPEAASLTGARHSVGQQVAEAQAVG